MGEIKCLISLQRKINSIVIENKELLHFVFVFLDNMCAEKVISLCLFTYKLINENFEKLYHDVQEVYDEWD